MLKKETTKDRSTEYKQCTHEVSAINNGCYKTRSPKKCRQQKQIFQMLPCKPKRTRMIGHNTHTNTHTINKNSKIKQAL